MFIRSQFSFDHRSFRAAVLNSSPRYVSDITNITSMYQQILNINDLDKLGHKKLDQEIPKKKKDKFINKALL